MNACEQLIDTPFVDSSGLCVEYESFRPQCCLLQESSPRPRTHPLTLPRTPVLDIKRGSAGRLPKKNHVASAWSNCPMSPLPASETLLEVYQSCTTRQQPLETVALGPSSYADSLKAPAALGRGRMCCGPGPNRRQGSWTSHIWIATPWLLCIQATGQDVPEANVESAGPLFAA